MEEEKKVHVNIVEKGLWWNDWWWDNDINFSCQFFLSWLLRKRNFSAIHLAPNFIRWLWEIDTVLFREAHRAVVVSIRCIKRLGVFLFPIRDACPLMVYPSHKFAGTPLYTWVKRYTAQVTQFRLQLDRRLTISHRASHNSWTEVVW